MVDVPPPPPPDAQRRADPPNPDDEVASQPDTVDGNAGSLEEPSSTDTGGRLDEPPPNDEVASQPDTVDGNAGSLEEPSSTDTGGRLDEPPPATESAQQAHDEPGQSDSVGSSVVSVGNANESATESGTDASVVAARDVGQGPNDHVGQQEAGDSAVQAQPEDPFGRSDVATRYPNDYSTDGHDRPPVDQPHQSPEPWAPDVNPDKGAPGRDNNCGECARAVESCWEGDPATAAALSDPESRGESTDRMTDWAEHDVRALSMDEIASELRDEGPGSSAVIACRWDGPKDDPQGHWFNAVNDDGVIKAVDGQSGLVETWPPSDEGIGFSEQDMTASWAVIFDRDGRPK